MTSDARDELLETVERILDIRAAELPAALEEAADIIAAATGAEKVDVFLHDAATETLRAVGVSRTPLGEREKALGLDRQPLANGGRAVQAYRRGEPYVSGHVDADPEELPGIRGPLGVRSAVLMPFEVEGARRGVLGLTSTAPGAFHDRDVRLARASARWVGIVAHRAEAVERLRQQSEEAGRRAGAEELVTVVAHDLRNYLNPIHGRIQLLKLRASREARERDQRDAEAAERALARLTAVVADLLEVARIDRGLFQIERLPLDLAALVREVVGAIEVPDRHVALELPAEVVVEGDPVKLRQTLDNLLANASRHAPAGSTIRVTLRLEAAGSAEAPGTAVVEVADQGPGVDPAVAPRLFARFTRGGSGGSLGLGMYLARQIALAHGGSLDFASEPGRGTTFALRLPACVDGAPALPR